MSEERERGALAEAQAEARRDGTTTAATADGHGMVVVVLALIAVGLVVAAFATCSLSRLVVRVQGVGIQMATPSPECRPTRTDACYCEWRPTDTSKPVIRASNGWFVGVPPHDDTDRVDPAIIEQVTF